MTEQCFSILQLPHFITLYYSLYTYPLCLRYGDKETYFCPGIVLFVKQLPVNEKEMCIRVYSFMYESRLEIKFTCRIIV
jgi:hypothetical protein